MKRFILIFFVIATTCCYAQEISKFHIQKDGTFLADDGKDYQVVDFKDKSAKDLYSMVKENIMSVFKSPKTVISENEYTSITINAVFENLYFRHFMGVNFVYSGNVTIHFAFKDGKIRIDAPSINVLYTNDNVDCSYANFMKECYNSKGEIKKNRIKDLAATEESIIKPIRLLLKDNSKEDW